jgi:hypothetical protein
MLSLFDKFTYCFYNPKNNASNLHQFDTTLQIKKKFKYNNLILKFCLHFPEFQFLISKLIFF